MSKIFLLFTLIITTINCCSIPDDCGSYQFIDWTGNTFSVDTREVCTGCDWFGICWASKCEPTGRNVFESAENNLLNNLNYDIGSCFAGDNGCSGPDWKDPEDVYNDLFHEACQMHDRCYSNKDFTQLQCDKHFHENMKELCDMQYPEGETAAAHELCENAADVWYTAVTIGGNKHNEWSGRDCISNNDHYTYVGHMGCPWMDDAKYPDIDLNECKQKCDELSGCISIEYFPKRLKNNNRQLCVLSKSCTEQIAVQKAYTATNTVGEIYFFTRD